MDDKGKQTIREKLRNLLERAKRTDSVSEAASCLRIASKLADEHAIDLLELEGDEPQLEWHKVQLDHFEVKRMPPDVFPIAQVLMELHVKVIRERDWAGRVCVGFTIYAFGREEHVAVADYVWNYLRRKFQEAWVTRKEHDVTKKTFFESMSLGLIRRLEDERPLRTNREHGLIVAFEQRLQDAAQKEAPVKLDQKQSKDFSEEGYTQGRNTSINMPLPSPASMAQARLEHV